MRQPRVAPHHDVALDEARHLWSEALEESGANQPLTGETVPLSDALGRITSAPVYAVVSSPHYPAVAMDGIAVHAKLTEPASAQRPLRFQIGTQAIWVSTGEPVPPETDAVIMVEHVRQVYENLVEITEPARPGQHIRPVGEDLRADELLFPVGTRLGPAQLGAVAAGGLARVEVRRRPRVAILPTGGELVPPGAPLLPGRIIEFNSLVLAGQVREWGGMPTPLPPTSDDVTFIKQRVSEALEDHDMVVVNAGSSAGSRDFTARVIESLGRVVVHGVAIRPGHPVVLGICTGKPVLGLPGYPVAAALTSELFLSPLIHQLLGVQPPSRPRVSATLQVDLPSSADVDEFVRVRIARAGTQWLVSPLARGAGAITSLARADGLVHIPRGVGHLDKGTLVEAELLRAREEIRGLA